MNRKEAEEKADIAERECKAIRAMLAEGCASCDLFSRPTCRHWQRDVPPDFVPNGCDHWQSADADVPF